MAWRPPRRTLVNFPEKISEAEFVGNKVTHAQTNSIQHWQLRDLISTAETSHEVYCVDRNQTLRYDTVQAETTVLQDLAYQPTSMTVGYGFLVAGGQQGQLDVLDLTAKQSIFSGSVADNVNNALHIGRTAAGDITLLVSNNDCTVKVFSLPGMERLACVDFPVAINYASMSPCGERLVCVGDSDQVFLCSVSGTDFKREETITEGSDSRMSCAWNAAGTAFAAASQDGVVCVWESRMSNKLLARLNTQRACRAVKFSRGAVDLLLFSEHEATCHVVDARTYDSRQVLQLGGTPSDISGISFCPDGKKLFIGLGEQGIVEYDVDHIGRRSFPSGSLL